MAPHGMHPGASGQPPIGNPMHGMPQHPPMQAYAQEPPRSRLAIWVTIGILVVAAGVGALAAFAL